MCVRWNGTLEYISKFTGMPQGVSGDEDAPSTDPPRDNPGLRALESSSDSPSLIPVPDTPPLPAQLPPLAPSSYEHCAPS